ncbi:polyketide cyclase [Pedobacter chinensis]|uniref:Polyketide cyclase n=1 Tax=Pedobacter chinensis TaxID=2282421 RepID=A0A369Q538_9SPHI|nr:SRPBCC family protein [Pedobacter chinensis]RDC58196.1 polyketide cyclase [Pedobacter chinensis]
MENRTSITVETTVNTPVEKVWQYWSAPEHITKWTFASGDWHVPYADNDLKTGGKFKTTMAAKDGSEGFDFEGTYSAVEENKLIEYNMADGRQVKITFEENDGKTRIVETFDAEEQNSVEMQKNGWQSILDNFKKYTEEN